MNFSINSIADLEQLSHKVKWQYFEKLVAFIFEQNGFEVQHNKVLMFPEGKRQFDVLAQKFNKVYSIECKKQQHLQISAAMDKHAERSLLLAKHMDKDVIPIIVTLNDEVDDAELPVIPLLKLNAWIND